jgi:hypothetical protein
VTAKVLVVYHKCSLKHSSVFAVLLHTDATSIRCMRLLRSQTHVIQQPGKAPQGRLPVEDIDADPYSSNSSRSKRGGAARCYGDGGGSSGGAFYYDGSGDINDLPDMRFGASGVSNVSTSAIQHQPLAIQPVHWRLPVMLGCYSTVHLAYKLLLLHVSTYLMGSSTSRELN